MTSFLHVGGACFGLQFVIHSASMHVRHLSGSRYLLRNSSNLLVDIPKLMPMLYHLEVRLHTASLSSRRLDKSGLIKWSMFRSVGYKIITKSL